MGCCQSEGLGGAGGQPDFKTEIVGYERREENYSQLGFNNSSQPNTAGGAMFEDNFYIDSVERYNVKYKPPPPAQSNTAAVSNATGGSGAPG